MKKITQTIFGILSILSLNVSAQEQITVEVSSTPASKDSQPSFLVVIPQTNVKGVEKDWLKYIGSGSKGKAVIVNGDHLQTGVVNKNVTVNPFDVYSRLRETNAGVRLSVWLPDGNMILTSKEPNNGANLALQKIVRDFAVQEYRQAVQKELKSEQSLLKKLEGDLASLIKGEEKSRAKVSSNERESERGNESMATNTSDIRSSSYKISDQKVNVARNAADPNAQKGSQKTLGQFEDEKKSLQKDNEKEGRKMDERNKNQRAEQRKIHGSLDKQNEKQTAIENQKKVVQEVQAKLDNIK